MDSDALALLQDLSRDPRTPQEALQYLWPDPRFRVAVLRHPNCPHECLVEVGAPALDSCVEPSAEQVLALRHPRCPAPLLERAVRSGNPHLVAAAAACPDLPPELVTTVLSLGPLDPRFLLEQARIAEAKRLVVNGWNVRPEHLEMAGVEAHD